MHTVHLAKVISQRMLLPCVHDLRGKGKGNKIRGRIDLAKLAEIRTMVADG